MQRVADVLGCETDDLTYLAKIHFAGVGSERQTVHPEVLKMLDAMINKANDDDELRKLWPKASAAAKKAALAVLRSMADNSTEEEQQ